MCLNARCRTLQTLWRCMLDGLRSVANGVTWKTSLLAEIAIYFHQLINNLPTTASILPGTKRRSDSLFVGADEDFDDYDTTSKPGPQFMLDQRAKANDGALTQHSRTNAELIASAGVPTTSITRRDFPNLAVYLPAFGQAEQLIAQIVDGLLDNIAKVKKEEGYENEELDNACGTAGDGLESCRNPSDRYPSVGPTACVGATGKGKSSTINSVTEQRKAAYEHTGGKRGTYMPHEFAPPLITQTADYNLEVVYCDETTIVNLVKRFVISIFEHKELEEEGEEDEEDEKDDDEKEMIEMKKNTAVECLTDTLCGLPKFRTSQKTEDYIKKCLRQGPKDIINELTDLVKDAIRQDDRALPQVRRYNLTSVASLQSTLKLIGRPSYKGTQRSAPSNWPFLRVIRIRAKTDVLRAGLVVADTPGVGDKNAHVVAQAEFYMKYAGPIMIVNEYDRSADGTNIQDLLRRIIRLGKMHDVLLVVPKIDQQPDYAEEDMEELEEDQIQRLKQADATIEEVSRAMAATDEELHSTTDVQDVQRLHQAVRKLQKDLDEAKRARRQAHVLVRCEYIKAEMAGLMKTVDKSKSIPDLEVFPISNPHYQAHLANMKDPNSELPFLDLEATGIPVLRRRLLELSAGGKHKALQHIGRELLPWTLNGINGILTRPAFERKKDLRKVIEAFVHKNSSLLRDLQTDLLAAYDVTITKAISENQDRWVTEASHVADDWAAIGGPTTKAICSKKGEHKKKSKGSREVIRYNWNEELLEVCKEDLDSAYAKFKEHAQDVVRDFVLHTTDELKRLRDAVKTSEHSKGMNMQQFDEFVRQTGLIIANDMENQSSRIDEIVTEVRTAATMVPPDGFGDFYVREAMKDIYMACKVISAHSIKVTTNNAATGKKKDKTRAAGVKTTVTTARIALIKAKLKGTGGQTGLYRSVGRIGRFKLENGLEAWANGEEIEQEDGSKTRVEGLGKSVVLDRFELVLKDFDRRFKDSEVKKEENPRAVMRLQEALQQANQAIEGPLVALLDDPEESGHGLRKKIKRIAIRIKDEKNSHTGQEPRNYSLKLQSQIPPHCYPDRNTCQ
ncbi:uncharacterized protein MYCFIDRAFT_171648 [Pseudocercospora fijiensis CIRAD86]|uniref:DUF7605 domain-containing protein n=1 Tax=Pseudocercospora fijiensis (strain CIRAD86) TaxID=383855 RepID=M3B939_PSEFD|nr:uncharacterized protein MYCFIDRAFT_171648 [Pseudocercospora fijiensis CIRAD86]EME85768.1 hypothetical protein MYCFIDRAFT_171648 [Pseudocercospora fijiensis CIRAD86]